MYGYLRMGIEPPAKQTGRESFFTWNGSSQITRYIYNNGPSIPF